MISGRNIQKMKQDLFKDLPSEITINILSRLPVVTVIQCKCVCKPWLDLIKTSEFAKLHLSKSVPGLAVFRDFSYGLDMWPKPYKFYEYIDMEETGHHHCNEVFSFNLPLHEQHICSSVNGLLFLSDKKEDPRHHFICNPITRDYVMLPRPDGPYSFESKHQNSFGFGVSKTSGQYKVVTIFHKMNPNQTKCQVYTLGTGSWRNIEPLPLMYAFDDLAVFVDGNLYWIVRNMFDDSLWLSSFDLETEEFQFWSLPDDLLGLHTSLAAMEELGLIVCDGLLQEENDNVVWLLCEDEDDEDGDFRYWTKLFVITSSSCYGEVKNGTLCPIRVFEDGNILLAQARASKLVYSMNPEVHHWTDVVELYEYDRVCAVSYTPSFISVFFHSQPSHWRM